ncbi:hypothetical protein B0H67DRAFT_596868 [Lasiosphaeris hirsuta]|uniref:Uncharacterized protein n=1 Tax=Lasiosphaeris hirsuta TaxID=260670 RepID=A0AA40BAS4_9PEZI|nr:hypothetical protein B0H67DRAFT_596868 [Lasiosphaeris hirsuta]
MSVKPTLSLSTPVTANFPHIPPSASELRSAVSLPSAVSERTPLSAVSRSSAFRDPLFSSGLPSAGLPSAGPFSATLKQEHDMIKTPITPPVAYLDFLKSMSLVSPSLASPPQTGRSALNRSSTLSTTESHSSSRSNTSAANSDDSDKDKSEEIESAPSTARSEVSCEYVHKEPEKDKEKRKNMKPGRAEHEVENDKAKVEAGNDEERPKSPRPAPINTKLQPTPRGSHYPLSAPAAGPDVFPSMKLPASPAISNSGLYSPRSPLSAASVHSPFDWDAALKSRRFADTPGSKRPAAAGTGTDTPPAKVPTTPTHAKTPTHSKRESRSSIRHIREVVTRTVTYTPRMAPAPKGKRRKLDTETAVES